MEAAEATWRLRSDFILWYDSPREVGNVHKLSLDWRPRPQSTISFGYILRILPVYTVEWPKNNVLNFKLDG